MLVFGARLPEVGRSLGKGMMEFKRGLRGVQDEMSGLDRESDRLIDAEDTPPELRERLAREEADIQGDAASDEDRGLRMAVVRIIALRRMIAPGGRIVIRRL